ncbi:MAG: hypothetical protein QW478_14205 [Candidatus Micrarchaeaceae archaeon]
MENEITIDWDDCFVNENFEEYLDMINNLNDFIKKHRKEIKDVFYRVSSRENGIHIKIIFKHNLSILRQFQYRAILDDDALRIRADLVRSLAGKEINRLWDGKIKDGKVYKAKEWMRYVI